MFLIGCRDRHILRLVTYLRLDIASSHRRRILTMILFRPSRPTKKYSPESNNTKASPLLVRSSIVAFSNSSFHSPQSGMTLGKAQQPQRGVKSPFSLLQGCHGLGSDCVRPWIHRSKVTFTGQSRLNRMLVQLIQLLTLRASSFAA